MQNFGRYVRNDSACGGLSFTGTVTIAGYVHTDVYLGGISAGESLTTGGIPNYDGINFFTKLDKVYSGTWRLTGKNMFTGWTNNAYHVNLQGGTLIADYTNDVSGAGSNRLFVAGRTVNFSDSRLVARSKAGAGNTPWQTLGTNTVSDNPFNVLTIDGNRGSGTTVALSGLAMSGGLGFLRVERLGNATFCLANAITADPSATVRPVNGVLMGNSGAHANLLIKDPDGRVVFASQNDALEIVRNTNMIALTWRDSPSRPTTWQTDAALQSMEVTLSLYAAARMARSPRPSSTTMAPASFRGTSQTAHACM